MWDFQEHRIQIPFLKRLPKCCLNQKCIELSLIILLHYTGTFPNKGFAFFIFLYIIHNITDKAVLKFGSEAWVLKKRVEQHLEAAQMKFLRHLLGITKLNKEKNQYIRQKTGAQNTLKEIKQYQ